MRGLSEELATKLFREFVQHSVIGMVAFDESGHALFENSRAQEILELRPGSDWSFRSLVPDSSRVGPYTPLTEELTVSEGLNPEVLVKKATGDYFLAAVGVGLVKIEGRAIRLITFQDVTHERKMARDLQAKQDEIERASNELVEQNKQLLALDQAKDRFIALTTHELRTPLSAILATADVLELKLYDTEEQKEEFIRTISEQGRHLMELVNDVLDFAKIRAGKMDLYIENVNLVPLIEKIAGNFAHMAEQAAVEIETHIEVAGGGSMQAWTDVLRLKEVVNNVVSNAVKYNREGGTVKVRLSHFKGDNDRSFARIAISDTGVGIPDEMRANVFNEFETIGHVAKHHKGTGLGMPISKKLMEQMGGQLTFVSKTGVGSEFFIDVPLEKVLANDVYRSRPGMDADLAA